MSLSQNHKRKNDDISGTSNEIAHGKSDKEIIQKSKSMRAKLSQSSSQHQGRVDEYYNHGENSKFYNSKRRENLRADDRNPASMDKLNQHQKRALTRRKKLGGGNGTKQVRADINRKEAKRLEAAISAADAEVVLHSEQSGFIEAENEMERTYHMTQDKLRPHLDEQTAAKIYDIHLDQYSPYGMNYDRSGRCGLLYGTNGGHVALMDMHTNSLKTEFHLGEQVRDVTFLHNTTLFAVAQKKHAFIYDDAGIEIHRLSDHQDIFQMQFLPHHWLLSTIGRTGYLKYHDTSTGELVSQHRSKLGPCSVMAQNQSNAVIHCGHMTGVVTLWSPASSEYLVKMLCHKGNPVQAVAIDQTGRYMVTGGADSQVKIWDLRMYKETHAYYTQGGPPTSIDISQRGVLGIAHGARTTFWTDAIRTKAREPYMSYPLSGKGPAETLRFRPFEDVCGIGHTKGYSSIVIPGSGEANLDSMEYNLNPYQDSKQRREAEVRSLLDKLRPGMISLDSDVIGTVEEGDHHSRLERTQQMEEEANARKLKEGEQKPKEKKRMRGRSKISKKLARKKKNIIDENVLKLREARETEKAEAVAARTESEQNKAKSQAPTALKRFFKK